MEGHGERATEGTQAERVDFGVDEVLFCRFVSIEAFTHAKGTGFDGPTHLNRVPSKRPSESRNIDHHNRTHSCVLDGTGRRVSLIADTSVEDKEDGHVQHSDELACDAGHERAFTTDVVDEEESAEQSRDEFDNTEDGGGEQLLLLTRCAHHGEILSCVDGDRGRAGPLGQELGHDGQLDAVEVRSVGEELADGAEPAGTLGRLTFAVELVVDIDDLALDVPVVLVEVAELGEVGGGFLVLADLDQPAGGFDREEAEEEGDGGKVDVHQVGHDPLQLRVFGDVQVAAVAGEVGQHDSQVDGAGEHAHAETADGARGCFGEVGGCYDGGLANANAGDEAAGVDHADGTVGGGGEKDGDAEDPEETQLASCPETADFVGEVEGDQGAEDRSHLNHSGDVSEK